MYGERLMGFLPRVCSQLVSKHSAHWREKLIDASLVSLLCSFCELYFEGYIFRELMAKFDFTKSIFVKTGTGNIALTPPYN